MDDNRETLDALLNFLCNEFTDVIQIAPRCLVKENPSSKRDCINCEYKDCPSYNSKLNIEDSIQSARGQGTVTFIYNKKFYKFVISNKIVDILKLEEGVDYVKGIKTFRVLSEGNLSKGIAPRVEFEKSAKFFIEEIWIDYCVNPKNNFIFIPKHYGDFNTHIDSENIEELLNKYNLYIKAPKVIRTHDKHGKFHIGKEIYNKLILKEVYDYHNYSK